MTPADRISGLEDAIRGATGEGRAVLTVNVQRYWSNESKAALAQSISEFVPLDIVIARGPGPDSDFIEAEVDGRSVRVGTWIQREDGNWTLRILVPKYTIL